MEQKEELKNEVFRVSIPGTGKVYEVGRMGNAQLVKVCHLVHQRDDYDANDPLSAVLGDAKLSCKVAAAIITGGFFKMWLLWGFRWRWLYYVRQWDSSKLSELIEAGVNQMPYAETLEVGGHLLAAREILGKMRFSEMEKELGEDYIKSEVERVLYSQAQSFSGGVLK